MKAGGATFHGEYRYLLWRADEPFMGAGSFNDPAKTVAFIMLNPSTANAHEDDPTIRRCIRFAKETGHSRLLVANIFALRSTDPMGLVGHSDPIGPLNDGHLIAVAASAELVVAAWGAFDRLPFMRARVAHVEALLAPLCDLHAMGTTKDGHPRHPLYLRRDALSMAAVYRKKTP